MGKVIVNQLKGYRPVVNSNFVQKALDQVRETNNRPMSVYSKNSLNSSS